MNDNDSITLSRNLVNELFLIATLQDNLHVASQLLAAGADIHTQNDRAMLNAASFGYNLTIFFLLSNGADIHAGGDFALVSAVQLKDKSLVSRLLKNGADATARDCLPMRLAAETGEREIFGLLSDSITKKKQSDPASEKATPHGIAAPSPWPRWGE